MEHFNLKFNLFVGKIMFNGKSISRLSKHICFNCCSAYLKGKSRCSAFNQRVKVEHLSWFIGGMIIEVSGLAGMEQPGRPRSYVNYADRTISDSTKESGMSISTKE